MQYLVVLGREAKISLAELEALFSSSKVKQVAPNLAVVTAKYVDINRLGGALKVAKILDESPLDYLSQLPEGKITLGVSDYSAKANQKSAWTLALKYKNLLKRHGRNVRLIPGKSATISTATAHHNQLGEKLNHIEIIIDQQRPPCGDFNQVGHYTVPVPEEPAEIFTIKQQEEPT